MKLITLIESIRTSLRQPLLEVNFNRREVIDRALNANLYCGFEAEIVWTADSLEEFDPSYSDVFAAMSVRDEQHAHSEYEEWVSGTNDFRDIHNELIQDRVYDITTDPAEGERFIQQRGLESELNEYIQDALEQIADKEDRRRGWSDRDWMSYFIDESHSEDFAEWADELARINHGLWSEAVDLTMDRLSIEDWAEDVYGSPMRLATEYEVSMMGEDDVGAKMDLVAGRVQEWIDANSRFTQPAHAGEYHSGAGITDRWRVESDTSISGPGIGAELISPVYNTPQEMLGEMASLFAWLEDHNAITNQTTGLHVTMSMSGNVEPLNRLKMAVLLGDRYVLKQFDRLHSQYARSRHEELLAQAREFSKSRSIGDFEELEAALRQTIRVDRHSSINFKSTENDDGNPLVEFRIGGGENYHKNLPRIRQAVVRYATMMLIGHDPEAYRREYIRAVFRLLQQSLPTTEPAASSDLPEVVRALFVDPELAIWAKHHSEDAPTPDKSAELILMLAWAANRGDTSRKPAAREIAALRKFGRDIGVTSTHLDNAARALVTRPDMMQLQLDEAINGWHALTGQTLTFSMYQPARFAVSVPPGKSLWIRRNVMTSIMAGDTNIQAQPDDLRVLTQAEAQQNGTYADVDWKLVAVDRLRDWPQSALVGRLRNAGVALEVG